MIKIYIKSISSILFIFCFLFSFVDSQTRVSFDHTQNFAIIKQTETFKKKSFILDFDPNKSIPFYIKVTVTPEKGESTPVLCFSTSDVNCLVDRQAIIKRTNGKPAFLFVKREQISDSNTKLFILVTCPEDICSYTLTFEGDQSAVIDINSVYSYLVSKYNKEMVFEVYGTVKNRSFLNIGVEGSSTVALIIDNVEKDAYNFDNGRIITFPIIETKNYSKIVKFVIKNALPGEYLTLSVHAYADSSAEDNFLYPNGPTVMGYLEKNNDYFAKECFPISAFESENFKYINKYYLTGTIYSKYALIWLADENGMNIKETEKEILDGQLSYLIETNGKKRSVCFDLLAYKEEITTKFIAFSASILEPISLKQVYNFYPPQTIGQIYRRMLPKGSYGVFHGAKIDSSVRIYNYNLYNRKGVTEMYIGRCSSYPHCIYTPKEMESMTKLKRTNKMTIWDTTVEKSGASEALEENKNVMIVNCKDDDNEEEGYCEFETSIFTEEQAITLVENEKFYKHVSKEKRGTFRIIQGGIKIQKLYIDIMIFSGDVNFNFKENIDIVYHKYYLSNKILFIFNIEQLQIDTLEIEYKAEVNSFFSIQYGIDSYNLYQSYERIPSGENYLVQIDPYNSIRSKNIYISNNRNKMNLPFLVNFFALNCKFQISRDEEIISFKNDYAQDILLSNTKGYKNESYEYKIKIDEFDISTYNHKMCMLYVSGYETQDIYTSSEIVIPENINQKIIFDNNLKQVRFLYPHSDIYKDLALYINVIDKGIYTIKMYLNNIKYHFREFLLSASQIFFIDVNDIYIDCRENSFCNIIFEVEYIKEIELIGKNNPMIELTIRQIINTPSYLKKNQIKQDFVYGDKYYYFYTDIGKKDVGEITVNFLRYYGDVYGRIVPKDLKNPEENANWRGIYRMPFIKEKDGLSYNGYIKKLSFGIEETEDCIEGCYLLLSISLSQIGNYADNIKFYPFYIIAKINPSINAYTDIPKIVIKVDEIVIGNVDKSENERINEFYQVWLPKDSFTVEIEWQSEIAGLYINIGDSRPTTKNADIILLPKGIDGIYKIDKMQILEAAKKRKIKIPNENSIQDLSLVVGIWTDKIDSGDTTLYSLKVHQPYFDEYIDIIEVHSDQKVLCSPVFLNDINYRCLFMITFDDDDAFLEMPILIYAQSLNHSAITYTCASYIDREIYDTYDLVNIRRNIPTSQTAQYNTLVDNTEFIYTTLNKNDQKYLFVSVFTDKEYDIMLITSMPIYNRLPKNNLEYYPNPGTEQLMSVQREQLKLKFNINSNKIVNLVSLGGEADIKWANDDQNIFYLKGKGDRLSLTSGANENEIIIKKRKSSSSFDSDNDPGFVFYVSYFPRDPNNNFDKVEYGKSVEISYKETDLPLYFYSKILNYNDAINIVFTFKDSNIGNEGEYYNYPFIIMGTLTKENTVYNSKINPELTPSLEKSIIGSYDLSLQTSYVFLSREFVQSLNLKRSDNPTLYLSINNNSLLPNQKYKAFNVEVQFSEVNNGVYPIENKFIYGRNSDYYTYFYRLKVDKKKKIMIIEIAFNSDYLDFAISDRISRTNYTAIIRESFKKKGKIYLIVQPPSNRIFIVLTIFKRNFSYENNILLYNYVFKYINVEKEEDFVDFNILDNDGGLTYKEEKDPDSNDIKITCTFNKIDIDKNKANITYFFKIVKNETYIYNEKIETIAVVESPHYVVYKRNPEDTNGKITLTAKGNLSNWVYLQVIAQIQHEYILEYVAYKGIFLLRPPIDNN